MKVRFLVYFIAQLSSFLLWQTVEKAGSLYILSLGGQKTKIIKG